MKRTRFPASAMFLIGLTVAWVLIDVLRRCL